MYNVFLKTPIMLNSVKLIFFNIQFWLRLAFAFFIPFLFFSAIMNFTAERINLTMGTIHKPTIGLVKGNNLPNSLRELFRLKTKIIHLENRDEVLHFLELDSIHIGLVFDIQSVPNKKHYEGEIECIFNGMQNSKEVDEVLHLLEKYEDRIIDNNAQEKGLENSVINPIVLKKTNILDPFLLIHRIMEQVKGIASNTLNLIFILIIIWSIRALVIKAEFEGESLFVSNLFMILIATLLHMIVVYIGIQTGINSEVEGVTKSLVLSIQNLLTLEKLTSLFILWLPNWLFIIGLFGVVVSISKNTIMAYSNSFAISILLFIVVFISLIPVEELGIIQTILPITNVFGLGHLIFKDISDSITWYTSFMFTSIWAVLINFLWFKIKKTQKVNLS
ncbi:MAG: hypothetical protein MK207_07630 [Saprospiraceae bacterium]|nr:hypothetical protein [Saprospiraceae bacterium]